MRDILVVGAGSGIGRAVAERLAGQGERVWCVSRSVGDTPVGPRVSHHALDATAPTVTLDFLPETLQGVVYCPGSITLKPFAQLRDEALQRDLDVNLFGAVRVLRAALPRLKKAEDAAVVLFSTVAVGTGLPYHASVAAAKGAVEGLTRALAAEFAPRIRVNAVAPSLTDTPLAAALLASEEKRAAMAERHPLRRVGRPEDVAALVVDTLLAPGGWMTGQVLALDGGLSRLR